MRSFPPSLQGLRLLQEASSKREEAQRLEGEAERMEAEGWGKLREAITGSEAEGLYGLLRGITSSFHPLPSTPLPFQPHISPSPSVHSQPPQEPTQPNTSDPVGPATMPAPVATTPATGDNIPVDLHPLEYNWGAPKGCINAGWKVAKRAHPPHMPLSAPTSGECTWAWAGVPPLP